MNDMYQGWPRCDGRGQKRFMMVRGESDWSWVARRYDFGRMGGGGQVGER